MVKFISSLPLILTRAKGLHGEVSENMVKCASCGKDKPESEMQKFKLGDKTYDVCNDDIGKVRGNPYLYLRNR